MYLKIKFNTSKAIKKFIQKPIINNSNPKQNPPELHRALTAQHLHATSTKKNVSLGAPICDTFSFISNDGSAQKRANFSFRPLNAGFYWLD
jgi:hypothetical protein